MKRVTIVLVACLALAGCGKSSLSGTYVAKGGSGLGAGLVMEKVEFISDTEVNLTMMEQTFRVPYRVDGDQVLFTANGQSMVFKIDGDGCLDGGTVFGKLCKA